MPKPLEQIFGLFRWRRAPAARIDGGAAEYGFEMFQTLPTRDVIDGNGHHVMGQLYLTSPGLVALHPAKPPIDVLEIPQGRIVIGEPPVESEYQ